MEDTMPSRTLHTEGKVGGELDHLSDVTAAAVAA